MCCCLMPVILVLVGYSVTISTIDEFAHVEKIAKIIHPSVKVRTFGAVYLDFFAQFNCPGLARMSRRISVGAENGGRQ